MGHSALGHFPSKCWNQWALGQSNALYDPDCNGDGCYAADDLLCFLSLFGNCGPLECGDPLSHFDHSYETVQIGAQCWFAEHLRSVKYANGDDIPSSLTDNQWNNADYGGTTIYGEDSGCSDYSPDIDSCDPVVASLQAYGRLYNWYAVNDERGLCPSGWHVPTEGEWYGLVSQFGGYSSAREELKSTYGVAVTRSKAQTRVDSTACPGERDRTVRNPSSAGDIGVWWTFSP